MADPARSPSAPERRPVGAGRALQQRIAEVGRDLGTSLGSVLAGLPEAAHGPQRLASALGLDKVLTSRLLKLSRKREPLAVVWHAPGPEPLRRFLRAARKQGSEVAPGFAAVDAFESLIRTDVGDRGSLDALISAWLPEARAEFEIRRRQAAYKAMSQLKGVTARVELGAVLLHPSADGERIDVVWIMGRLGLERLRPGVSVRFVTRRMAGADGPRKPETLTGVAVEGLEGLRLDAFCDAPPGVLEVTRAGDAVHYILGGDEFGPGSGVDLLIGEVNRAEMAARVPAGSGRKGYVFTEVGTPVRTLLFDVFVHADVYPDREPALHVYDAALEGVADVNDPARDIDRVEVSDVLMPLGAGIERARIDELPAYHDLLVHAFDTLDWDAGAFRGYRCRMEYPLHGSQVAMAFDPPEAVG